MIKTNKFKISKKLNFLKFSNFKKFKSEVQTFRKSATNSSRKFRYPVLKRKAYHKSYFYRKFLESENYELLINSLKKEIKFLFFNHKDFNRGRIYFKYTGSNMFLTITSNIGNVFFIYSSGIFKEVLNKRAKTNYTLASRLGELLALRLYQTNARALNFIIQFNVKTMYPFIKKLVRRYKLIRLHCIKRFLFKANVTRNGIRLKNPPRRKKRKRR